MDIALDKIKERTASFSDSERTIVEARIAEQIDTVITDFEEHLAQGDGARERLDELNRGEVISLEDFRDENKKIIADLNAKTGEV